MPKIVKPARPVNLADAPALVTIPETCQTLRISRATCCRWLADGRLEGVKIGRAVRIKTASIAALAA